MTHEHLIVGAFGAALVTGVWAQTERLPAIPREPISVIVEAAKSHQIVAFLDAHGHEQLHQLNLALVRDRRISEIVNDIVVEFGNALHQDAIDRFVRGEDVPYEMVRRAWMDTTQAHPVWDTRQPEEFFRAVRAVNTTLPAHRRLRVLLGDPPIDWNTVKSKQDHSMWLGKRESFPAELIRREVLAKGRRAVVLYGVMHLQRKNAMANFDSAGPAATLVSLLEDEGAKLFSIGLTFDPATLQPTTTSWPRPSITVLRGTVMGAAEVSSEGPRVAIRNGRIVQIARDEWKSLRMEEQFDALLYIGARSEVTDAFVAPELCRDPAYIQMRNARMALVEWKASSLQEFCR
jgi:hypothetical protein